MWIPGQIVIIHIQWFLCILQVVPKEKCPVVYENLTRQFIRTKFIEESDLPKGYYLAPHPISNKWRFSNIWILDTILRRY